MNEELLYNQLYDKTKDCGRTQFVKLLMEKERENKNLKDEIYKSNAVADTNIELAEKYYKEKQELINYLKKEDIDLKENVVNLEEKLRNTSRDSFYYNSYLKTLHRFRAKRELIKEILSKIEKSDK